MTEPTITVMPKLDTTLYIHYVLGEAEFDGWKVEFSTTGNILLLKLTKPGERMVRESIDLNDLYEEWVNIALARRDQEPPPPANRAQPRMVRKKGTE